LRMGASVRAQTPIPWAHTASRPRAGSSAFITRMNRASAPTTVRGRIRRRVSCRSTAAATRRRVLAVLRFLRA